MSDDEYTIWERTVDSAFLIAFCECVLIGFIAFLVWAPKPRLP